MSESDLLNELWTRILFETSSLDTEDKHLVRGVVYSVISDIKNAHEIFDDTDSNT